MSAEVKIRKRFLAMPGQNPVGDLLRRHRVAAEQADQALHLRVLTVNAGDVDGVDQRRVDRARNHHRHPDVVSVPGRSAAPPTARAAELAGAVGGVPGQRHQPGGRRHVDQMTAPAGGDHRRQERLDDVDRTHQVDVDHRPPVLVGQLLDGAPRRDAGDVHHDVHAGWRAWMSAANRGHRVVVGDVQRTMFGHLARPAREHRRPSVPDPSASTSVR